MSFAQFQGQEQVVQLLQRSLERGRLSHAYLFYGSSLEVLEQMARTLAQTLNCQDPPSRPGAIYPSDCCDRCLSCRKIAESVHPDVQWVRPESKSRVITIDQMRALMQTISLKPTEAKWKVAVIVAADRLNVHGANAFLKTLEEPPPQSVILLLTTEPERILDTILSRCLRLSFAGDSGPRVDEECQAWLKEFSSVASRQQSATLLSRYQLLGTLLAKLNEMKAETEKALNARSPLERYDEIEPRLREKWEDELAAAVEAEYRRRRGDLLLALQWWLRDVWLQALSFGKGLLSFPALAPAAGTVAARISQRDALRNIDVIEETQRLLGSNVQEALALEVGLLRLKL
ncbi:MAG: ATP-binding protein [Verrucomicrobiia bacterium]